MVRLQNTTCQLSSPCSFQFAYALKSEWPGQPYILHPLLKLGPYWALRQPATSEQEARQDPCAALAAP